MGVGELEMTENDVPSGSPAGLTYLVPYDEDLWNALDDERQDFCKEHWIKVATPLPDVRLIALRLIPDPLFPSGANESPYIAWQHEIIEKNTDPDYTMSAVVSVTMSVEWTASLQSKMMRDMSRAYPSGSRFEIRTRKGALLSKGVI